MTNKTKSTYICCNLCGVWDSCTSYTFCPPGGNEELFPFDPDSSSSPELSSEEEYAANPSPGVWSAFLVDEEESKKSEGMLKEKKNKLTVIKYSDNSGQVDEAILRNLFLSTKRRHIRTKKVFYVNVIFNRLYIDFPYERTVFALHIHSKTTSVCIVSIHLNTRKIQSNENCTV